MSLLFLRSEAIVSCPSITYATVRGVMISLISSSSRLSALLIISRSFIVRVPSLALLSASSKISSSLSVIVLLGRRVKRTMNPTTLEMGAINAQIHISGKIRIGCRVGR